MSWGQWLFEYRALRLREKDENERTRKLAEQIFRESVRAFRFTLIDLLGLNIGATPVEEYASSEDGEDDEEEINDLERIPHTPLIFFTGRPEMVKDALERHQDYLAGRQAGATREDEEALSTALSQLSEGDIAPIFQGGLSDDPFERWTSEEMVDELEKMGIHVRDGDEDQPQIFADESDTMFQDED